MPTATTTNPKVSAKPAANSTDKGAPVTSGSATGKVDNAPVKVPIVGNDPSSYSPQPLDKVPVKQVDPVRPIMGRDPSSYSPQPLQKVPLKPVDSVKGPIVGDDPRTWGPQPIEKVPDAKAEPEVEDEDKITEVLGKAVLDPASNPC